MKPHVLISGGTGLIGSHLAQMLISMKYKVTFLTRQYRSLTGIEVIRWDPNNQWLDTIDIKGPIAIINLAGENLSARAWTPEQKKAILSSRVNSLKLIKRITEEKKDQIVRVLSTSAIGYYGTFNSKQIFSEDDDPGSDFLAKTCVAWEDSIKEISDSGISTAWLRTGVVMSDKGGSMKAIMDSMRTGFSMPLGSGKQWVPWIHIRDLIKAFEFLLKSTELVGPYNAVAPSEDTNMDLTKAIAKTRNKKVLPIGVPDFFLKMILGEMASLSLYGSRVSPKRIIEAGFNFQFSSLPDALQSFQLSTRVNK